MNVIGLLTKCTNVYFPILLNNRLKKPCPDPPVGASPSTELKKLQVAQLQFLGCFFTFSEGAGTLLDRLSFRFSRKLSVQPWHVQYAGCLPAKFKLRSSSRLGIA